MTKDFDFKGARKEGYSDQEIASFLGESNPDFDVDSALQEGYSPEEISVYLSELKQPSRGKSLASAALKGVSKGANALNPMFFGPVPTNQKFLNKLLPSQEKDAEDILERAGELAPLIATGPEGIGLKIAETGLGALGGHLAEQEGYGKGGQFVSELVGLSFPGLIKSLGSKGLSIIKKGATKGAGEAVAKIAQVNPQQVKKGVMEAAERLGVKEDLPLSAQIDNPLIQSAETKLFQSVAGGPIQKKVENLGGKLVDVYKESGRSLSTRENMLPGVISEEAINALRNIEENSVKSYRSLYNQASKMLPEGAATAPKVGMAIHKIIDSTLKKLKSDLGTPAKDALYNRLNRLKDSWSQTLALREGNIPITSLETLKQDLNQVIKYEVKGGVDKLLKPLQGITKEGIQSYGREFNRPYLTRFNQAEKTFGETAKTFRKNPLISSLIKGEKPELIFGKMNSVKGINELEKVMNKSIEGKEILDALKKYKLEDILNKKILDKNGEISWGKAAGIFKEPKTKELVLKLVGQEHFQKLKDLSKVASGVEDGFKKFINTSKSATTIADYTLMVGLPIKAAQQLFTGNVLGAIKTTSVILSPRALSKLITNPKFIEAAINTAKAGKGASKSNFLKNAQKVARFTTMEMFKDHPSDSSENEMQGMEGKQEQLPQGLPQ